MSDGQIRLRSYRLAFDLERRIHRIDTFRIPLPYGLPLAALGWAAATLVLVLVASSLPLTGTLLGLAPWPLRVVFLPGLAAHLLCRTTADSRPLHEAMIARGAFAVRPKHRRGLATVVPARLYLDRLPVIPDERGHAYRAGTVAGPAVVVLRQPGTLTLAGKEARLAAGEARPLAAARDVRLREGQRLVVE